MQAVYDFFRVLDAAAARSADAAAAAYRGVLSGRTEEREAALRLLAGYETACRNAEPAFLEHLRKQFLTPVDRMDLWVLFRCTSVLTEAAGAALRTLCICRAFPVRHEATALLEAMQTACASARDAAQCFGRRRREAEFWRFREKSMAALAAGERYGAQYLQALCAFGDREAARNYPVYDALRCDLEACGQFLDRLTEAVLRNAS